MTDRSEPSFLQADLFPGQQPMPHTQPGGTSDQEPITDDWLDRTRAAVIGDARPHRHIFTTVRGDTLLALVDELQQHRANGNHMTEHVSPPPPDPIVNAPLSRRLQRALGEPGFHGIALYHYQRDAIDALTFDARTLNDLGLIPYLTVSTAHSRIRFGNGSEIIYLGGDRENLEQRLRGSRANQIDNGHLVSRAAVFFVTGEDS